MLLQTLSWPGELITFSKDDSREYSARVTAKAGNQMHSRPSPFFGVLLSLQIARCQQTLPALLPPSPTETGVRSELEAHWIH